jgi:hypothetical protein
VISTISLYSGGTEFCSRSRDRILLLDVSTFSSVNSESSLNYATAVFIYIVCNLFIILNHLAPYIRIVDNVVKSRLNKNFLYKSQYSLADVGKQQEDSVSCVGLAGCALVI